MLNRLLVATVAILLMGAQDNDVTRSPPLTKGTGLAPDADADLPARVEKGPPPQLSPLIETAAAQALGGAISCAFRTEAGTVLVAGADRKALASPDGQMTPMLYEGPELRLGGFFTAGAVTIVVQPDSAKATPAAGGGTAWAAAVIVDRAGRNVRQTGTWWCRA